MGGGAGEAGHHAPGGIQAQAVGRVITEKEFAAAGGLFFICWVGGAPEKSIRKMERNTRTAGPLLHLEICDGRLSSCG